MKLRKFKKRILTAVAVLTASLLLIPCLFHEGTRSENIGAASLSVGNVLTKSADAGEEYLSRAVFFGESTTAHLARTGGVLDTPSGRDRVWRDKSGTRMLDRRILASSVTFSDGTERTVRDALVATPPDLLVLSFGLNGIVSFAKDVGAFIATYRAMLEEIHDLSPATRVIVQSIYPVRAADAFSVDVITLNRYIDVLNEAICQMAGTLPYARFADTSSVLRDESGFLAKQYDAGDGIHLTNVAYEKILFYLRTHAWLAQRYIK